jgi:hypothetical protein
VDFKISFKQYLQLDESVLLEVEKKKKKIPKPKPRPKKNLWFQDKNNWHADLQFAHGAGFQLHHTVDEENEEDKDYYATEPDGKIVWGVWKGKQKRGITFHKPRHLAFVKHPRVQLKQLDGGPSQSNNITSRPTIS